MAKKKKAEDSKPAFDPQEARLRLLETTLVSIEYADAGQRAPLVREARALITDIAGVQKPKVEAESSAEEGSAVVNFQERLAKQRSASSSPRRRRTSG